jgi:hypothetical protein
MERVIVRPFPCILFVLNICECVTSLIDNNNIEKELHLDQEA